MKPLTRILAFIACSLTILSACNDDVTNIGSNVMPVQDSLSTSHETFFLGTRSVLTGPVLANTNNCYIGSYIDPETNTVTTSSFLAQFHLQEGYTLPDEKLVLKGENGKVIADSCVIRIFHDKYYGDSLAVMKLTASELSIDNVMKEEQDYYTDIDPQQFVSKQPIMEHPVSVTYTVIDQNLSSSATNLSSGNYRSIPIHLGEKYGTHILQNYYDHPEYFKNSYTFAHKVCPGFYIQHTGGIGTLINADMSALDVYFRYQENDTTVTKAWMRLGATQEVIQNTNFSHNNLATLFDSEGHAYDKDNQPYTYLKSPAGIHTEITLPIQDIAYGKLQDNGEYTHENDTINSARLILRCYKPEGEDSRLLAPPPYLLLVRKGTAQQFIKDRKLPDAETSFLCEYNSSTGTYSLNNIAPLITYLRKQRDNEAMIAENCTEQERQDAWAKWERENPDWNKLELIPVTANYTRSQSYYGSSSQTLSSISNDYNLHSVRLEGGIINTDNTHSGNLQINVIYSRFKQ